MPRRRDTEIAVRSNHIFGDMELVQWICTNGSSFSLPCTQLVCFTMLFPMLQLREYARVTFGPPNICEEIIVRHCQTQRFFFCRLVHALNQGKDLVHLFALPVKNI